MIREPAVAGRFYAGTAAKLRDEVRRLVADRPQHDRVLGVVAPHAGYMYSGKVAGEVYARIEVPETVVVLGPNHTGAGPRFSLWPEGSWRTPLGEVPVDAGLARRILDACPLFRADTAAHAHEHCDEVHLPFLQHRRPDVKVVCGVIGSQSLGELQEAGRALHAALVADGRPFLLVASSDMTHYEPAVEAEKKDRLAIDRILALDPEGLHRVVLRHGITMCGFAPTVLVLTALQLAGATKAELVRYANSGDASGDYDDVVAYAGITIA